jgi:ATP-dependent Lon protease
MVFVGNINQSVESLVKTSHLLAPFPEAMIDSAFFDRFHAYVPGWEIPKMRPEFFTNQYGLIVDYLAEYLREMRKYNFADAIDKWFKLGNNLNQRDTIAVRRTVSGLLKLICPAGDYEKEIVRKCLEYALETRRRVKEQLKKIGGMEFYDVHFSYIDLEMRRSVSFPFLNNRAGALIPDGRLQPGTLHTISMGTPRCRGRSVSKFKTSQAAERFRPPARHQRSRCGSPSITSRPTRHGSVHRSSRGNTIFTSTSSSCRMRARHRH